MNAYVRREMFIMCADIIVTFKNVIYFVALSFHSLFSFLSFVECNFAIILMYLPTYFSTLFDNGGCTVFKRLMLRYQKKDEKKKRDMNCFLINTVFIVHRSRIFFHTGYLL